MYIKGQDIVPLRGKYVQPVIAGGQSVAKSDDIQEGSKDKTLCNLNTLKLLTSKKKLTRNRGGGGGGGDYTTQVGRK